MRVFVLAAIAALAAVGSVAAPSAAAPTDCGGQLESAFVLACSPVDGSRDVPHSTRVTVTFAQPMNAFSITRLSFTLLRDNGPAVLGTVQYNPLTQTATLTPIYPLDYSRKYIARLDAGIQTADGRTLGSALTWSFRSSRDAVTKRVNSGGPAYVSSAGDAFMADTPVSGSLTVSGGAIRKTGAVVTGTNDPALYADERFGVFTQNIIVPSGTYDVQLHFAETQGLRAGRRIFHVDVLETPELDLPYLDIARQVGAGRALVKTIANVSATSPFIRVRTIAYLGEPIVAAIEVVPVKPRVVGASSASPQVRFDRPMDETSFSAETVTLSGPAGSVPASVAYDAGSQTATVVPSEPLAASTEYAVRVEGVAAVDGIGLAEPFAWSFTTQP